MQANEFEKKVQQKMEELQLYPSAGVWPEVEKKIRRQKRRRRIIFWWLLPLLLAGGGTTLFIMTRGDKDKTNASQPAATLANTTKNENNTNTISTPTANNPAPVTTSPVTDKTNGQVEKTIPTSAITIDAKPVLPAETGKQRELNKKSTEKGNAIFDQQAAAKKKITKKQKTGNDDTGRPGNKKEVIEKTAILANDVAVIPKKETGEDENKKFLPVTKDSPPMDNKKDSTAVANNKKTAPADSAKEKEPVTKSPQKKKQDWEWGVNAAGGISTRASGFSLFPQAKAENALSTGNPGTSPQPPALPGKSSNGLYAMAGVYAKKKLGKKTAVSMGIDFSYYSTAQQTGVFVDSSRLVYAGDYSTNATGYYRNGTASNHHSNYFFVSTPLSIHWQLNKGKKVPLVWENSLSPRILLGSNALVYDAAYNIYYRDRGIFRKFQLSYQTGIYGYFGQNSKHPYAIGLFLNSHISQLQKVETDNRNHLFSFGVQVKWTLKK